MQNNPAIRGVEIEGIELLHANLIPILDYLLEQEPDRKLNRIIVKGADGPKGVFGRYYPELGIFVLNLEHAFNHAVKQAKDASAEMLSLSSIIWMNLIWTIGHEIHHAVAFATDTDNQLENAEYMKKEDEEADDYGDECVKNVARLDLNIEPPALGEMPYFGLKAWEMVIQAVQAGEEWGKTQQEMVTKGYAYSAVNFDLASLREYVRLVNGNPDWEDATHEVTVEGPEMEERAKVMVAGVTAEPTPVPETAELDASALAPSTADGVIPEVDDGSHPVEMEYEGPLEYTDISINQNGDGEGFMLEQPYDPDKEALDNAYAHINKDITSEYPGVPGTSNTASGTPWPASVQEAAALTPHVTAEVPVGMQQPAAHPSFTQTPSQATMNDPKVQVVHEVYKKVIAHLFANVWNPRGMWKDGNALWAPVDVTDIQYAREVVLAFATNKTGMRQEIPADGKIMGRTFKNHTIPGYDIIMSINGVGFKRRLIAQNPFKMSQYANRAQAGEEIVWIIDIATNNWQGSYQNGVWHPN